MRNQKQMFRFYCDEVGKYNKISLCTERKATEYFIDTQPKKILKNRIKY